MKQLWYRAALIFAFSIAVVGGGYFLTALDDRMALRVQSGAVENKPVIVLDAGHGGMDGGAVSGGIRESEINLAIAEKARKMLTLLGYRVVMTRETDTLLADENAKTVRQQNHFSQSYVHGAQVFYGKAEGSERLAELIQKNIAGHLQTDNRRRIKEADSSLYILCNNTGNPAVMVECGFLSNPQDAENLQRE